MATTIETTAPTLFPLAAVFASPADRGLPGISHLGLSSETPSCIGPTPLLSSTLHWGSWQIYDGTASGRLVGLDYFGARYFSGAQGRFTSPDEFTGGIVDPFTGQQISQPGPLPYADITNPQSLNKYAYVLNNPLRYVDPDGHAEREGALSLVQDWFDVIEIKGSVGLGVGVGGQAGAAQYKLEYTLVGAEGKIGLGGGGGEMKGLTGFKAAGQVGTVGGQVTVGAQVSTKDGATGEGSVQVNAGAASAKLGVKANSAGVTPISNATVKADVKIGAEVKAVAGVGVSVNLSQAARASQNTAQAARTTWQVLKNFVANKVKELQGTAQGAQ